MTAPAAAERVRRSGGVKRVPGAMGEAATRAARAALHRARRALRRFPRDRSGATALEYGLICLLIFLAIVSAIRVYTSAAGDMYASITNAVTGAIGNAR